jgi:IclR family pca regulon transcriptional regulator
MKSKINPFIQESESGPRYFIKSLDKGLIILETFARAAEPLTLKKISKTLGISPTTMFRFLYTLEKTGYIEREEIGKAYKLTPKVLTLGHAIFHSSDLWQITHPYLVKTSKLLNETLNMAILDGTDILYLDRIKTQKILGINLEIGSKLPVYCTSMGRVLLSGLPSKEAHDILLKSKWEKFTTRTLTDIKTIEEVLRKTKKEGYALNDGELAPELKSIAAPIKNESGRTVAAVNIAVNASQYDVPKMKTVLLPELRKITETISAALGYKGEKNE